MAWIVPPTQTPGQPATAGWANLIGGDLTQINTVMPMVSGGLTGAISVGRFVGFVNGAPPSTGSFVVGDFAFDISTTNPRIWACTSSGSAGGWASIGAAVPTGTIVAYGSAVSDPAGWLLCDGRAISRTTFAALYSVLVAASGTDPFGTGDGSSTFNLPDLRGRTIFGADNMGTGAGGAGRFTANNTLGAFAQGEFAHVLVTGELAAHNHGTTDSGHGHGFSANTGTGGSSQGFSYGGASTPIHEPAGLVSSIDLGATGLTINNSGSNTAHNTIPLYQICNFIVKT